MHRDRSPDTSRCGGILSASGAGYWTLQLRGKPLWSRRSGTDSTQVGELRTLRAATFKNCGLADAGLTDVGEGRMREIRGWVG
jgi:hypothetical protein